MNLVIETDPDLQNTEILIRCAAVDEHVASIVASLQMHERRIIGKENGETFLVPVGEVLYLETVDRRTFAYTRNTVLEVSASISEIMDGLKGSTIMRAAKSCLINLCHVRSLRPYVGGRLLARFNNDEEIIVSRKYAKEIKQRLGV